MKVVLINHSDTKGGASIVTFRLMQALRRYNIDARMLVLHKGSRSEFVYQVGPKWRVRYAFLKEQLRIYANNGHSKKDMFLVSVANAGLPLHRNPLVKGADVVVLNWINQGMLSMREIMNIARVKPVVWTMHDMWNMTGICHHAGNCDKYKTYCQSCHLLNKGAGPRDLSTKVFNVKGQLYNTVNIHFVAVSDWLYKRAMESELLSNQNVRMINNAFPTEIYSKAPKYTREQLGLPAGKALIVFCAARCDDPMKDLPMAIRGLNQLHEDGNYNNALAVFVGAFKNKKILKSLKMPYKCLGVIDEQEKMQSIMSHALVVLNTSPFESLPTVLIEGQAAGAMPVSYTHDGRADIISNGMNGYSILPGETPYDALCQALSHPLSEGILRKAAIKFSYQTIAARYIKLFRELCPKVK